MPKMTVTIDIDADHGFGILAEKSYWGYGNMNDEDYLAMRLQEVVDAWREQHIYQAIERSADARSRKLDTQACQT